MTKIQHTHGISGLPSVHISNILSLTGEKEGGKPVSGGFFGTPVSGLFRLEGTASGDDKNL
jgi:hypothetical protein